MVAVQMFGTYMAVVAESEAVVPHEVICARFKRLMNRCKPLHHLIQCIINTTDFLLLQHRHSSGLTIGQEDSMTMLDEEDLSCPTNQLHL